MKKNIVAGVGEIGRPILKLVSKQCMAIGYDTDPERTEGRQLDKHEKLETEILHVCMPFSKKFETDIITLFDRFKPELIVIHSTIMPNTTARLQKRLPVPVLYSATRGVHSRMSKDLRRYTKYFALEKNAPRARWAAMKFTRLMKKCGVKTARMSSPVVLELAKIVVDTSYYGWLINYAQISKIIADKYTVDYDEMWEFADEIHKYLGNRPKMFPGFIGGHCLDPGEMLFIRTDIGMRPVTIKEYVEGSYCNDVLSYDPVRKRPCFDKVTAGWGRLFSGTMITLTSRTNRPITTTDRHVMVTGNLSERLARDVAKGDLIPFAAELPETTVRQNFDYTCEGVGGTGPISIAPTPEFCRLLGYYVSSGTVLDGREGQIIEFVFGPDMAEQIAHVCSMCESLGLDHIVKPGRLTRVCIKSTSFSLLVSDRLGCGRSGSTKCLPEFIYFASRKQKELFLDGFFGGNSHRLAGNELVGTGSPTLDAGLDMLLLSTGRITTLNCVRNSTYRYLTGQGLLCETVRNLQGKSPHLALAESRAQGTIHQTPKECLYMLDTVQSASEDRTQMVYSIDTKSHLFVSTWGRLVHNCVIPNLEIVDEGQLYEIDSINNMFAEEVLGKKRDTKKHSGESP